MLSFIISRRDVSLDWKIMQCFLTRSHFLLILLTCIYFTEILCVFTIRQCLQPHYCRCTGGVSGAGRRGSGHARAVPARLALVSVAPRRAPVRHSSRRRHSSSAARHELPPLVRDPHRSVQSAPRSSCPRTGLL